MPVGIDRRLEVVGVFAPHALDDDRGQDGVQLSDVAAQGDNLPNQAAAGQGELIAGHHEHRLDAADGSVGHRQLKLIAQVGGVAYAAEDRRGLDLSDKVDSQAGIALNPHAGGVLENQAEHVHPFFNGEHLSLFGIYPDRDDQFVKQSQAAMDHVQVAVGERIELAGKYADS